jgi:hypothetical protein
MLRKKDRGSGALWRSHTDRDTWLRLWSSFIQTFAPPWEDPPDNDMRGSSAANTEADVKPVWEDFFDRGEINLQGNDVIELKNLRKKFKVFHNGKSDPTEKHRMDDQRRLFYGRLWGTRYAKRSTLRPQWYFGSIGFHLLDDILLPDLLLPTLQVSRLVFTHPHALTLTWTQAHVLRNIQLHVL